MRQCCNTGAALSAGSQSASSPATYCQQASTLKKCCTPMTCSKWELSPSLESGIRMAAVMLQDALHMVEGITQTRACFEKAPLMQLLGLSRVLAFGQLMHAVLHGACVTISREAM